LSRLARPARGTGAPRSSGHQTQLLLAVYIPTLLLAFAQGLLVPTLPLYASTFEASFGLVSLAVGAGALGTVLADLPAGMVLERLGRRPMMLIGTGLVTVSSLGLAFSHSYPELIVYRLAGGVGTAFWGLSRMAFMTDVIPLASRGRSLSTFGGMMRVGSFVGPAAGGLVASWFGLASPFVVAGGLSLAATLVSAFYVPESGTDATRVRAHLRWRSLGAVARRHARDLLGAGTAQVLAMTIRTGRQIIVPLYGAEVLGLDVATVGTIISIAAALDMALFYPAGVLMDRLGRKYASIPSFLVMGAGMALLPLADNAFGLLLATLVMGLGNGLGSGAMLTLGADLAPRQGAGEFLGLWRLIGDAGQLTGPLVVGAVADGLGLGAAAVVLAAVGVLAAWTIYAFVAETLPPEPPPAEPPSAGPPSAESLRPAPVGPAPPA
jgi:MFS family permease